MPDHSNPPRLYHTVNRVMTGRALLHRHYRYALFMEQNRPRTMELPVIPGCRVSTAHAQNVKRKYVMEENCTGPDATLEKMPRKPTDYHGRHQRSNKVTTDLPKPP